MRNKCYLVYVEFTSQHRSTSLNEARSLLLSKLSNYEIVTVIVDNSLELKNIEIRIDASTTLIYGDNSSRDMSGYDRGVQWLLQNHKPAKKSLIAFCNDTLSRSTNLTAIKNFSVSSVEMGIKHGGVLGYIDAYPKEISLFGLNLKTWIRTNFIIVPFEALKHVLPIAIPHDSQQLFSKNWKSFFNPKAPLSENYKRYLRSWLFGEKDPKNEFHWAWHSAKKLSPNNFEEYKVKVRAILSEHAFSANLKKARIPIIGMNNDFYSQFQNSKN